VKALFRTEDAENTETTEKIKKKIGLTKNIGRR